MNAKSLTLSTSLAAAFSAALAAAAPGAQAADKEACYGVALKGQNDCAAGDHNCAGEAKADYSRTEFKYVAAGTCAQMTVEGHKGALAPT